MDNNIVLITIGLTVVFVFAIGLWRWSIYKSLSRRYSILHDEIRQDLLARLSFFIALGYIYRDEKSLKISLQSLIFHFNNMKNHPHMHIEHLFPIFIIEMQDATTIAIQLNAKTNTQYYYKNRLKEIKKELNILNDKISTWEKIRDKHHIAATRYKRSIIGIINKI